jgi:hypothetical protein
VRRQAAIREPQAAEGHNLALLIGVMAPDRNTEASRTVKIGMVAMDCALVGEIADVEEIASMPQKVFCRIVVIEPFTCLRHVCMGMRGPCTQLVACTTDSFGCQAIARSNMTFFVLSTDFMECLCCSTSTNFGPAVEG